MKRANLLKAFRGFTLIETLMAVAISALIVGTLGVAIYQFSRLTKEYQHSFSAGAELENISTLLNHDVIAASSGRVITSETGAQLALRIPHVTPETFAEPTVPPPIYVTYTYTAGANSTGQLTRNDGGGERLISNHIESLSFGPSRTLTSTVWVEITVTVGAQSQSATLMFERRPSE